MFCHNCGNENRETSSFCRNCGTNLNIESKTVARSRKLSPKILIIIGVFVVFSGGVVYAAPKINDYFAVTAGINKAKQLQAKNDYNAALTALIAVQDKWALQSNKQELENMKNNENAYIQDQKNFELALSTEASGSLTSTEQLLQSIPIDFPEYSKVQIELTSVQN